MSIKTPEIFAPLLKPARYKAAHGGRGSAKSHFFADLTVMRALQTPGYRQVCVREVQKSLKESVKLLIEDKIRTHHVVGHFMSLSTHIVTPGDGVILFQGMADHTAESVKSLEGFDVAYVEEAQTMTKRSLEFLRPTIRKPNSEIWFSWNPRHATDPVDQFLRGLNIPPDAVVVESNYMHNPFFPEVLEEERLFDEQHNPVRYAHIWLGEYEPQALGAIFNMANINEHRRSQEELPEFKRVLVSVDPAGSSEEGSDETGVVVTGVGEDDRGYVLDDLSLRGGPREWAERALAGYDLYDADAIVAETNYGGDMVVNTIKAVRPTVRVIKVNARPNRKGPAPTVKGTRHRAKAIRAEPISALYQLGRISHAGAFPKLEAQMCLTTAAGYEGEGSPDRLDALVWGLSELFPKMTRNTSAKRNPVTHAARGPSPHRWRG